MPIYEYQCTNCGHQLEKLQKISDVPLADCPECQKPTLKKMLTAGGFRLKGTGWYETDFKGGKKNNQGDSKSSDSSASAGSSSETKQPKPAANAD